MTKYKVSYSMDVTYEVDVDAASEEEARAKVNRGDFNSDREVTVSSEMLGINTVEEIV